MKNVLFLAVVLAICVTPVWSQGGPGPGGPPPGAMMAVPPTPPAAAIDGIAKALGLTTDQATALTSILEANDAKIGPLMAASADADKALRDAVVALDFDSATQLGAKAGSAQLDVVNASIAGWAQIKASAVLTADQLAALMTGPGPVGCPPPPGSGTSGSSYFGAPR